ncbi:hypothetical protein Tco_0910669 [Tanacetum coccineum]|uniref:Uncharacterized protein n=1 Tax=Tanacetum coccineum TaxID=301880 RepID=A0ABQ5CUI3_9ASTR
MSVSDLSLPPNQSLHYDINDQEDLLQIDEDAMEEIGHSWRFAKILGKQARWSSGKENCGMMNFNSKSLLVFATDKIEILTGQGFDEMNK